MCFRGRIFIYFLSACPLVSLSAQDGGVGGEREERPPESCLSPEGGRTHQQSQQQPQGGECVGSVCGGGRKEGRTVREGNEEGGNCSSSLTLVLNYLFISPPPSSLLQCVTNTSTISSSSH